jgi:hypothetical protein
MGMAWRCGVASAASEDRLTNGSPHRPVGMDPMANIGAHCQKRLDIENPFTIDVYVNLGRTTDVGAPVQESRVLRAVFVTEQPTR